MSILHKILCMLFILLIGLPVVHTGYRTRTPNEFLVGVGYCILAVMAWIKSSWWLLAIGLAFYVATCCYGFFHSRRLQKLIEESENVDDEP